MKECVQELAHGLELQAGFASQPVAGALGHVPPQACELLEPALLVAHVGQALAHRPEAGCGHQAFR